MGTICHVDMDAFFAAVETRANPRLQGVPLVVGGGPDGRGVVTTASYAARAFGIRSGMSLREARSRCPDLVFCPVDPAKYLHASQNLLRLFEKFTPAIEPASIDEAFLDFSGLGLTPARALDTAGRIKKEVRDRERLTCSIGLGPNKLQAKMATALQKPDGLVQLLPGDFERNFRNRPVRDLWGIGPETSQALQEIGISTIGQLADSRDDVMSRLFGIGGRVMVRMARGEGGGPVVPYYEGAPARSMGHEITFPRDVRERTVLEANLLLLADKVSRRMRREEFAGHVISLKIKWSDRTIVSRQRALAVPTDQEGVILAHARRLLNREDLLRGREKAPDEPPGRVSEERGKQDRATQPPGAPSDFPPVRLLGLSVGHLISNRNLYPLFLEDRKARLVSGIKDRLRDRFGETILIPAGVLKLFQK